MVGIQCKGSQTVSQYYQFSHKPIEQLFPNTAQGTTSAFPLPLKIKFTNNLSLKGWMLKQPGLHISVFQDRQNRGMFKYIWKSYKIRFTLILLVGVPTTLKVGKLYTVQTIIMLYWLKWLLLWVDQQKHFFIGKGQILHLLVSAERTVVI